MPFLTKRLLISFSTFFFLLFSSFNLYALELKSSHFDVYMHEGVDTYRLLEKLNIKYFLHLDASSLKGSSDSNDILKDTLDAIYLEVSDILGIRLYSYRINLEIVPNSSYIDAVLLKHLKRKVDTPAIYFFDNNTIYIVAGKADLSVFAHEVAHAIISHYFVVPPPMKIQEVLCGYVEYSLNKSIDKQENCLRR